MNQNRYPSVGLSDPVNSSDTMDPPDPSLPPAKRHRCEEIPDSGNEGHYAQVKKWHLVVFSHSAGGSGHPSTSKSSSRPLEIRPMREVPFLHANWRPSIDPCTQESPLVVFAHGGGAPSTSIWMVKWKELIREALNPVEVVTFDYPYVSAKKKGPPKPEKLVNYHLKLVKDASAKYPGHPLVLMGKSLGSRVSCMISREDGINVSSIVCFGYPLKGMKGVLRDGDLLRLQAPTLIVKGSNDCQCPADTLEITRSKMTCKNEVYIIDGGDHSFQIRKKVQEASGMTQDQAERAAAEAVAQFVFRCIREC